MKSVSFLRNTWRKKDAGKPSPHVPDSESPSIKDGFWDTMDKPLASPAKKSNTFSRGAPRLSTLPSPQVDAVAFPTQDAYNEPNQVKARGMRKPLIGPREDDTYIRQRSRSLGTHTTKRYKCRDVIPEVPTNPSSPTSPNIPSAELNVSSKHSVTFNTDIWDTNPRRLLSKKSMPELDGVWKEFLDEVEEDIDSIRCYCEHKVVDRKARSSLTPRYGQPNSKQQSSTLPPSPTLPSLRRSTVQPSVGPGVCLSSEAKRGGRPRITTVSSVDSASSLPYLNSPVTPCIDAIPEIISDNEQKHLPSDFDVSLFPVPPPLNIRPSLSRKPSAIQIPVSFLATPDLTPNTTPITPRSLPSPCVSSRIPCSPMSILKKPSGNKRSATLPTPPATPDTIRFPVEQVTAQSRHIRQPRLGLRSHTASHIPTLRYPSLHRPSSSDSTSDKPTFQFANFRTRAISRPERCNADFQVTSLPRSLSPAAEVQWGYAV